MFDHPKSDDIDDEVPEDFGKSNAKRPSRESAAAVLAHEALEAALIRKSRAALKRRPGVFILQVPRADWTEIMAKAVKRMENAPMVKIVSERHKSGGKLQRAGGDELAYIQEGRSVMYISPDPSELLDETVLAAADLTITLPPASPALLRKVILRLTGGVARGVTEDMARLDLPVLVTVLRPEWTAGECVAHLQRAVDRKPSVPVASGPLLSELPLTKSVRTWIEQVVGDLAAIKADNMPPDRLTFAMLEGPPGTGKTLIAESLARTAGWNFVGSSVGSWFATGDGALGGVSRNLKGFIDLVLASEPAIAFMDELDALPDRATMDNRGRDWWTPVITLFLTEIDRLRKSGSKVLLLGASNYYSRLDSALIRPGRLQQRISVLPPETEDEVVALFRYCLGDDLPNADLVRLGRLGRGATPAMVEGWVKQSRSLAQSRKRALHLTDLIEQMVPEDNRTPEDIRAIALHEIGHGVVAHRLGMVVESVSIVPEGIAGGWTLTRLPTVVPTWGKLMDMVALALGGRAADIVVGAGPNAGAEADLAHATELLLGAHESQGLYDSLISRRAAGPGSRSEMTLKAVGSELKCQLKRAVAIIEADRDAVFHLADRLIAEKVLSGGDIAEAFDARSPNPASMRKPRTSLSVLPGADQSETLPAYPGKVTPHER